MKLIAPSILSADFGRLAEEIQSVEEAGADLIHIDVMDGRFVPNLTFGPPVIESIRQVTSLPFDVHLMIEEPGRYIDDYARAGADIITVHVEAERHLHRTIETVRERGIKAGVSLNPATPVETALEILPFIDTLMIMTVNPGFGGQSFISQMLDKIRHARNEIDKTGSTVRIEVDGGVGIENIAAVHTAGADIFVAGSAIFRSKNYGDTISAMKKLLDKTMKT